MSLVNRYAPDFQVEGVEKGQFKTYKLSDYEGKWVILFFYPLDFTFVCPTEIKKFNQMIKEFEEENAAVLGISIDSKYVHKAWIDTELGELTYPLLSDITREVSKNYGVLLDEQGHSLRATFIIDPEGIVKYELIHDPAVGRSVKEILRALKALITGELCPVDWNEGEDTLGSP